MIEWAQQLKAATERGAMLLFDGEIWQNPVWTIRDGFICFTSGNTTQMLLEPGDDPAEAERDLRHRLYVAEVLALPSAQGQDHG